MAKSNLSKAVAILAITAAWAIGVYGVFFIGANNGLFNSISVGIERRHFPGCPAPFKMKYTGVEAIDSLLIQLVPFFCILIDGKKSWDDAVSNWYLTSQWAAAWTLLSLEGIRRGNRGRPSSW